MTKDVKEWIGKRGEKFLRDLGVRKGHTLLDFGCGEGHYTIPAARVVGKKGKIYALDKDRQALDRLMKIAKKEKLKNIKTIKTKGELKIPLEEESTDGILLFDVMHSHYNIKGLRERKKLLKDVWRVAKPNSYISIFPKHIESVDIRKEAEKVKFHFEGKYLKKLIHDVSFDEGIIFKFSKSK